MEKKHREYYIGLDIGTDSVGYAVTDETYHVLKFHGQSMWGARLFDAAQTAAERRNFRSNRRRQQRKRWRIELLQELFAEEICKADPGFFQRMKDSALFPEDKQEQQIHSLFAGNSFEEAEYYKKYPTIYHLRKALITEKDKKFDIRLVYLALHHIMKHRGHFLFSGDLANATSFSTVFETMKDCLWNELGIEVSCDSPDDFSNILKEKNKSKRDKSNELLKILLHSKDASEKKQLKAIVSLMCGMTAKLADIFQDESLQQSEKPSISFSDTSYDETREILEGILMEKMIVIDSIKAVYDWAILSEILQGGDFEGTSFLSVAKAASYEKHERDLRLLKNLILKLGPDVYRGFFRKEGKDNYCSYIGYTIQNGRKQKIKRCSQEDFYKQIKKLVSPLTSDLKVQQDAETVLKELESQTFLPRQVTKDNGVIPYQIHMAELNAILENCKKFYPFLEEKDSRGLSVTDKIQTLFLFRVPYYVGPLNTANGKNSWMIRKAEGKIYPWNFEEKVDEEKSAEKFIRRMTNKCTYLMGKDVLPKHSLLYSEFMVRNELNNVKVNAEKLSVERKEIIFRDLFCCKKKVTGKMLCESLRAQGLEVKQEDLSGFDQNFQTSLTSYLDMKKIFGDRINQYDVQQMCENLILWITLYSEDKKMLKRVIRTTYNSTQISEEQLRKVLRLRYQGWGNLSREFLTELEGADKETGEVFSIIQALRMNNDNLMQLLSHKYTFVEEIEKKNREELQWNGTFSYETLLENQAASPAVKRAVWQSLLITKEIEKIMKKPPKKIFVEMTRGEEEKKQKESRKDRLIQLYSSIRDEEKDWKKELEERPESDFRSIKLFLYYTQMGRCMYSGEAIELSKLADAQVYDRDHIYPQSLTKDDSIDNLVLVKRQLNARKSNEIIDPAIQKKMSGYWKQLKNHGLISEKKYQRLMRNTPLTDEELAGFIQRQVVETGQSAKIVAELFQQIYEQTKIVYVKAGAVADFRRDVAEVKKVRMLNDLHHAKDAYLNIVVGNVYYEKFTSNPYHWIKNNRDKRNYNLSRMYDYEFIKNGLEIWKPGEQGTKKTVQETMRKNDIQTTCYAVINKSGQNGGFFDQNPVSRDDAPAVPRKKGLDVSKYGGYKKPTSAYFALVESDGKKGKKTRSIEFVPLYLQKEIEKNPHVFITYCENQFGLKNPRILIPKIKINSLFKIDGFLMYLKGRSENRLVFAPAVQLHVSYEMESYLKKIEKYLQRNRMRQDKKTLLEIQEEEGITEEENLKIFDQWLKKLNHTIYKNCPANQAETLENGRDKFMTLSLEEQCMVLGEILHLTQCNRVLADLTLIGGSKHAGSMLKNKVIDNCSECVLIHQSVTGLYHASIDLLNVVRDDIPSET